MAVIDMQSMRYINLLDKVSRVKTRICFGYNNTIFFAVQMKDMSRAIGSSATNIRKLQDKIDKKVKIIKSPDGVGDLEKFVEKIVAPTKFKSLEVKENEVVITAGSNQNKAALIGRNRRRFEELKKIVHSYFDLDLKIV